MTRTFVPPQTSCEPTPLTYPRPPALIAEYWKVVAHERQKMFRAWAAWLDQRPNPEHVEHEIAATESVLRQMVRLRDKAPSAEDGWVTCRDEQCRSAGRCIYRAAPGEIGEREFQAKL